MSLCCLAKDKIQAQNLKKIPKRSVFIDDQQPSSGSISVFIIIRKYTINSVLSVYHITILLHVMIYNNH